MMQSHIDVEPRLSERRSHPRIRASADVVLACGSQFFTGSALDISERGAFVATRRPLEIGARIALEVTLPCGQVLTRGVVRWRRGAMPDGETAGVGIEFEDLSDVDENILATFCGSRPRFITYDEVRAVLASA